MKEGEVRGIEDRREALTRNRRAEYYAESRGDL